MPTTKSVMKHIECTEILSDVGLTPMAPKAGIASVRDKAQRELFKVPVDIDPHALLSIVDYGGRQLEAGRRFGREQVKTELLALIGAQPTQAEARS